MRRRQLEVLGRLRRHARDETAVALGELRQAITAREQAVEAIAARRAAEASTCPPTLFGDWARWVAATRRLEQGVRAELEALRGRERELQTALLGRAADHRALELVLHRAAQAERERAQRRVQARLDEAALRAPKPVP